VTVEVNIYEAKTHLSQLLERVAAGERVVISRAGTPIADVVRHEGVQVQIGGLRGHLTYRDSDFEGVDPDIAAMFYGSDASS
jgi:prevent-host-death family protein